MTICIYRVLGCQRYLLIEYFLRVRVCQGHAESLFEVNG